jgi:single-strand DNA-binding protein
MSLNLVQIMGNLGSNVELRYLPDGRAVGNFSIACGEKWKDKTTGQIQERTEWIRVCVFGRRAEVIAEHFGKGSQIYVSGKMRTRQWEKDGVKHYMTEVVADEFQFCGSRATGDNKTTQQAATYAPLTQNHAGLPDYSDDPHDNFDDDIPF